MAININKNYYDFSEKVFFEDFNLKEYLFLCLKTAIFSIYENKNLFNENDISNITNFCINYKNLNSFNKENFKILSDEIYKIHSKYIYKYYKTNKGRTVNFIEDKYLFIKTSHNLFKNIRNKIFKVDYFKIFNVEPSNENIFFNKKNSVKNFKKNISLTRKNMNYVSYKQIIVKNNILYFLKNCSFGINDIAMNAIHKHTLCNNMVTFDISKFFNSFTLEKIKEKKLFENIFLYTFNDLKTKSSKNFSKQEELVFLEKIDDISYYFYNVFKAFSINEYLPTGSVFSADISNLLFFSIDLLVRDELKKFFSDKMNVQNPGNYTYTRYIDDVGISTYPKRYIINDITLFSELKKTNINLDVVKIVEKIFNKNGFFIKYDKTKVYNEKMPKKYLGFNIVPKRFLSPDTNGYAFSFSSENFIFPNKNLKLRFGKVLYEYCVLNILDKKTFCSYYHCLGSYQSKMKYIRVQKYLNKISDIKKILKLDKKQMKHFYVKSIFSNKKSKMKYF